MDLILSIENVDLQECDLLVIGFFQDERPLRGASGVIDWRLNGRLSHFLKEGKVTGAWEEMTLIPSEGRIVAPFILLLGLGKRETYGTLRLRDLLARLFGTLRNLQTSKVGLSFPVGDRSRFDHGRFAEMLLLSLADCLSSLPSSDDEWTSKLQLFFSIEKEKFSETLAGIQRVRSLMGERSKMRILIPSERRLREIPSS